MIPEKALNRSKAGHTSSVQPQEDETLEAPIVRGDEGLRPPVDYGAFAFAEIVGVQARSEYDLAKVTEGGIPADRLGGLRDRGLTFSEISELIISPRTLKHRRARREPLSNEESDRLVRVARIFAEAEDIFGSREKALVWLRTPDDRLENRTPLRMLVTESGGRLIENLLWQIDEGIYS